MADRNTRDAATVYRPRLVSSSQPPQRVDGLGLRLGCWRVCVRTELTIRGINSVSSAYIRREGQHGKVIHPGAGRSGHQLADTSVRLGSQTGLSSASPIFRG
jgi:hypothetical protein